MWIDPENRDWLSVNDLGARFDEIRRKLEYLESINKDYQRTINDLEGQLRDHERDHIIGQRGKVQEIPMLHLPILFKNNPEIVSYYIPMSGVSDNFRKIALSKDFVKRLNLTPNDILPLDVLLKRIKKQIENVKTILQIKHYLITMYEGIKADPDFINWTIGKRIKIPDHKRSFINNEDMIIEYYERVQKANKKLFQSIYQ